MAIVHFKMQSLKLKHLFCRPLRYNYTFIPHNYVATCNTIQCNSYVSVFMVLTITLISNHKTFSVKLLPILRQPRSKAHYLMNMAKYLISQFVNISNWLPCSDLLDFNVMVSHGHTVKSKVYIYLKNWVNLQYL